MLPRCDLAKNVVSFRPKSLLRATCISASAHWQMEMAVSTRTEDPASIINQTHRKTKQGEKPGADMNYIESSTYFAMRRAQQLNIKYIILNGIWCRRK